METPPIQDDVPATHSDERRAFLAKSGKIAVAAPAAALLLAASSRKALAAYPV